MDLVDGLFLQRKLFLSAEISRPVAESEYCKRLLESRKKDQVIICS